MWVKSSCSSYPLMCPISLSLPPLFSPPSSRSLFFSSGVLKVLWKPGLLRRPGSLCKTMFPKAPGLRTRGAWAGCQAITGATARTQVLPDTQVGETLSGSFGIQLPQRHFACGRMRRWQKQGAFYSAMMLISFLLISLIHHAMQLSKFLIKLV